MAGKFELYKDKAGEFRFRLKAGNGETLLTGEGYKSKDAALNGIESVKKNAADPARFEAKQAKNGNPYFVLKAANHQVIGQSEVYSSAAACDNGMSAVAKAVSGASIDEQA